MDLTNILNTRDGHAAASAALPLDIQRSASFPGQDSQPHSPAPSDFVSDREGSPHSSAVSPSGSDQSSTAYSIRSMPTPIQQSMNGSYDVASPVLAINQSGRGPGRPASGDSSAKSFPCSVCGKGFARRSDLARHERIHSGIRPHVCDYPGCDKQFIQRSALTVHARVHTGEKPHMCETCGKPFSDSSSLARHRRIHSGKRPYKCPYADCQKTFTRRTTLTRHQNHHTGTIEGAAAATAAALAARPNLPRPGRPPRSSSAHVINRQSDSQPSSTHTSPSPQQRRASLSPASDLPTPFRNSYMFMNGFTSHPVLLGELQPLTPRPTPTTTPAIPSVIVPLRVQPPTSNPSVSSNYMAALPPILEPQARPDMPRPDSPHFSGSPHSPGSPHISPLVSRGSPHLSGYHSPTYPASTISDDQTFFFPAQHPSANFQPGSPQAGIHYANPHLRRQHSNDMAVTYDSQGRKNTVTTTC